MYAYLLAILIACFVQILLLIAEFFNIQSVLLFAIWFVFMLTAFYGIYAVNAKFKNREIILIPIRTDESIR